MGLLWLIMVILESPVIIILIGPTMLLIANQPLGSAYLLVVISSPSAVKSNMLLHDLVLKLNIVWRVSAACELVWLKSLLLNMGFSSSLPMMLFCDTQATMYIVVNPVFHEQTKHIEVHCHFIRQQVQLQIIKPCYIHSHDQLADVFTKVLTSTHFHRQLSKLGSINPLDPAWGWVLKTATKLDMTGNMPRFSSILSLKILLNQGKLCCWESAEFLLPIHTKLPYQITTVM